jgi:hypothetical protein
MINHRRQENDMARRVKVASRAVRRGRRLRARASEVPPAAASQPASAPELDDEIDVDRDDEPAVLTPETRRLAPQREPEPSEAPVTEVLEVAPAPRFSRPSAPLLDFGAALDVPAGLPDAEPDDAAEEVAAAPAPRISSFTRPSAPLLDFGSTADVSSDGAMPEERDDDMVVTEGAEGTDPNATTLVSSSGPGASQPPPSPVRIVEAGVIAEGVIAEGEIAEGRELEDGGDDGARDNDDEIDVTIPRPPRAPLRSIESSLAPVVDDVDAGDDETSAPALLTPEEERRRRALRRGVGVAVLGAGVVTLVLVGKAMLSAPAEAPASRPGANAAEAPRDEAPATAPAKTSAGPTSQVTTPAPAASDGTVGAAPSGDFDALGDETVKLLSKRKFEEAIPLAKKLIEMRPGSAFGYRCLGSAYQDLGRYHEAQEVYTQCATHATEGEVRECTALGGRKLKR